MENKKPVVLVVESNEITASLIQLQLEKVNYSVITADNGAKAIEVLNKLKPDDLPCCIIMAIMMPEINGFEVCRRIKKDQRFKDIPIIMTSSLNQHIKSIKHGADGFISKPIEDILLLHEVGKAARMTQQAREIIRLNKKLLGHDIQSTLGDMVYDDDLPY